MKSSTEKQALRASLRGSEKAPQPFGRHVFWRLHAWLTCRVFRFNTLLVRDTCNHPKSVAARRAGGFQQPVKGKKHADHRFRKFLYSGALIIISAAVGSLLAFQYLGLSQWMGEKIQSELDERGITIGMRRLYIDPFGGVIAKDLSVYQTQQAKVTHIQIEKARFTLNWISWWRGEPFLRGATVHNADIRFPLTTETAVELRRVSANVELTAKDLIIRSARARIGAIHFHFRGKIILDGRPPASPSASPETIEQRAQTWRHIRREIEKLSSPVEISVEFETPSSNPLDGEISLRLTARDIWRQDAFFKNIFLQAHYQQNMIKLDRLQIQLPRGQLEAQGAFELKEKTGHLSYQSDADFTLLSSLLPENIQPTLKSFLFPTLPTCEGIFECRWDKEFSFFCRSSMDWKNFTVGETPFENFHALIAYDGRRLFISDFSIRNATGQITAELLQEEDGSLKGRLHSSLNPTSLKGLFGPKPPAVLEGLIFNSVSPSIDAKISGKTSDIKIEGKLELNDFIYTNGHGTKTLLASLSSPFVFENKILKLSDLKVTRVEGETGSAQVEYDFNTLLVNIKNGKTKLHIQKFTPVFGGKLETYCQPYRFHEPPQLAINGIVDLKEQKQTNLQVQIRAPAGMDYDFLKKTLVFNRVDADLNFVEQTLAIHVKPTSALFDGKISGKMNFNMEPAETPYRVQLKTESMNFQKILSTYFNKQDVIGTCSGDFDLSGNLNDLKSIKGGGHIEVADGDVYQIPVFGAFSELLSEIIPGVGYSKADNARADFAFENGAIKISEMEIFSLVFAVIGYGTYDYIKDDVDLSMRVNIRGPIGLPLFFVSKLFEYQGKGKLNDTQWEPKIF
ncbi:MAG: AsmA-like C-terminal region-containing protein [Verrucomicrobiota bacterium]